MTHTLALDESGPWQLTVLAAIFVLAVAFAANRITRWRIYNDTHRRFIGKYALSKEDEARGLKRMNQNGYHGVRDAQYVLRQVTTKEMPFLYTKALEYALFRTYGIDTIAKILLRTGNFVQADKSSRRYVDTQLLIVAFLFYPLPLFDLEDNDAGHGRPDEDKLFDETGAGDPRSAIALARVNFLHRRADRIHGATGAGISNEDLLYTLSVFVTQPIVWSEQYAWRKLSPLEKEAIFTVMYHVGRCMHIESIPDTLQGMLDWAEAFEQRRLKYDPMNHDVAVETVNLLLWAVPVFMRPFFFPVVASIMDDRLREAVGFAKPVEAVSWPPKAILYTAKYWLRWFGRPRKTYSVVVPYKGDGVVPNGNQASLTSEKNAACPFDSGENGPSDPLSLPRMMPKWWENDPHYSLPATAFSLRGIYERLFVSADRRYGASKWRRAPIRQGQADNEAEKRAGAAQSESLKSSVCPAGFRLEECGPRGTEDLGRDEIRREAEQLHGKPLRGPWAF